MSRKILSVEEWLEQLEKAYKAFVALTTRLAVGEWRQAKWVEGGVYRLLMRTVPCSEKQAMLLVRMLTELGLVKTNNKNLNVRGGQIDKVAATQLVHAHQKKPQERRDVEDT